MKSKRHESLHGAVLIMVLTVMFVLIIMLMATLTVVSTAGQRIYTKYEENQAYYTARSALDVFTQNMLSDADYYAYDGSGKRKYEYTDNTVSPAVEKDAEMKQGKALQLDLYKIRSQAETAKKEGYTEGTNTYNDLKWAENAVLDDNTFLTGTPEDENYSLSKTDSFTKDGTTYTGLEYIEYDVTLPAVSDGSNKYAKMLDIDKNDKDGDGSKTDQIARIKVEVLDRHYATDPTYTASQMAEIVNGSDTTKQAELQTAIQNGQRSKDYMKIKVTATVELEGVEGTAIVIFETTEKETPANNQAINTTGSFSGGAGAQLRAAGGAATMDNGITKVGDGNNTSGTLFTTGQFEWTSSATTKVNSGEMVVAMGGIASSSNPTIIQSVGDGAAAFLGGTSYLNNGSRFGYDSGGNPSGTVPVIAENFVKTSDSDFYVNGDMYVTTFDNQSTNPGKIHITGDMYVQNLVLPNGAISGPDGSGYYTLNTNWMPFSQLHFCKNYTITSGTNIITPANANMCTLDIGGTLDSHSCTNNYSSLSPFDINKFTPVEKNINGGDRIYRKYDLPTDFDMKDSKGNSIHYIEIPTAQSYFGEFFKDDAFHVLPDKNAGDLKNFTNQTEDDPAHADNDYSTIYSQTNKDSWLLTGADMLAAYLKDGVSVPELNTGEKYVIGASGGSSEISLTDAIGSGNIVSMPTGGGEINLDSGDKYYVLDNTYYGGTIRVHGTNGRLIILLPEGQHVKFENFLLVTDDINDTTTTIKNGTTKAPKIDIYGGDGANIETSNNCLFTAYFIMPTTTIDEFRMGKQPITYDDGKGSTMNMQQLAIVGSVVCKNFKCQNNATGIAYLDKNSGADTPGEPHLTVQASRYSRT